MGSAAVELASKAGNVIDLGGGVLMPAFAAGHAHPLFAGMEELGPQIRSCTSVAEVQAEVRAWADARPEDEWIVDGSYQPTIFPDGKPDAEWLDAVVPDRPVFLHGADYHTAWVNSRALELAGIRADSPNPNLGVIGRSPDGGPSGALSEFGAVALMKSAMPATPMVRSVAALERATAAFARAGVTWIQDAWVEPDQVAPYLEAARRGALSARFNLAFRVDPLRWREEVDEIVSARSEVEWPAHPRLEARTVKFFVDGVVEARTASLLAPYEDDPGSCGLPNWTGPGADAGVRAVRRTRLP